MSGIRHATNCANAPYLVKTIHIHNLISDRENEEVRRKKNEKKYTKLK